MTADLFSLSITLGNDGMQTLDDIAAALERVARRLSSGYDTEGKIRVNGNTVGAFKVGADERADDIMERVHEALTAGAAEDSAAAQVEYVADVVGWTVPDDIAKARG